MQTPETFLGLSGTGWTGVGSIISALSIMVLVMFNLFYLKLEVQGIKAQLLGIKASLFSGCPVLMLRNECDGRYSIYNCGQGPALMAQWAYGKSIPESTVESTGLLLFAYSVTNDKYLTTIKWPKLGGEKYVHFGTYKGELPVSK